MAQKRGIYLTDKGVLLFGRYKGETLVDVAEEEPSYIQWMKDELNLNTDEEALVDEILEEME